MNDKLVKEVVDCVSKSLKKLYQEDGTSLISKIIPPNILNNVPAAQEEDYLHAAERAVVFRWAYYLNTMLEPKFEALPDHPDAPYKLDLEYNRHHYGIKRDMNQKINPDLIIHRRDTDEDNLLVVECKGWWNGNKKEIDKDKKRLQSMTKQSDDYHYRLGIFITFEKELEHTEKGLHWYQNGCEYTMEEFKPLIEQGKF